MLRVRVPPEAALLFLLRKKELSSGVVAVLCPVSITVSMHVYVCIHVSDVVVQL